MPRFILFCLLLLPLLSAASPAAAQGGLELALLRVMHASPDAPAVDIYVDGTLAFEGREFFEITHYVPLDAGAHRLRMVPAGEPPAAAIIDRQISLDPGLAYTISAMDRLAELDLVTLAQPLSIPERGEARIQLVHAAVDAPAVNISAQEINTPFVEGLEFGDEATLAVPAGTYTFEIFRSGLSLLPIYTTEPLRLESGWSYTFVAAGLAESEGSFALQSRVSYSPGEGFPIGPFDEPEASAYLFATALRPLNTAASLWPAAGYASVRAEDDQVTFTAIATALAPGELHPVIYHGFPSQLAARCPTAEDDTNGDGLIDMAEVEAVAGPALVPLHDDPLGLDLDRTAYPRATVDGTIDYRTTVPLIDLDRALEREREGARLAGGNRLVIVYGVAPTADLPASLQASWDAPAYQTLPVACGELQVIATVE